MIIQAQLDISDLIVYSYDINISQYHLYERLFGYIPTKTTPREEVKLKAKKLLSYLDSVQDKYELINDGTYTVIRRDLEVIIKFGDGFMIVYAHPKYVEVSEYKLLIDDLFEELKTAGKPIKSTKPEINVITMSNGDFSMTSKELVPHKEFDINKLYNDDFKEVHDIVIKRLNSKNDKGLVLFYGEKGTGKSQFLKYLCSNIKDKQMVFVPHSVAANIADPSFITFFIKNANSVLIIEDAEQILQNLDNRRSSAVSNMLNIADGLLSDILNIQIVFTFNADISTIDEALLRKGRCIASYKFGPLTLQKTRAWIPGATKGMTLAEIFNYDDKSFITEKPKIGFNR